MSSTTATKNDTSYRKHEERKYSRKRGDNKYNRSNDSDAEHDRKRRRRDDEEKRGTMID